MLGRLARVVPRYTAKPAGPTGGPLQPTQRAGHISASKGTIASTVRLGMLIGDRPFADENLLRQNGSK
jgi:hypothetical protein